MKGIEFVEVGGQQKLFVGSRDTALLLEIDPATGLEIGVGVQVVDAAMAPYEKILALATHPETNVLYGIVQGAGGEEGRELVTINPTTGATTLLGSFNVPLDSFGQESVMASMAFVGFTAGNPSDVDDDGDVDGNDFLLIQRGVGGDFDAADIAAWKAANFGQGGGAAAVPEPTALGLACAALGAVLAARRRVG
jgi:hypothetical protein